MRTHQVCVLAGWFCLMSAEAAVTFRGRTGTAKLGFFENETAGIGDVVVRGLLRLYDDPVHHIHLEEEV